MEHGTERNHHMHREWSGCCGYEESRRDKWCAHCKTWVEVRGVTGALAFMACHDSADCITGEQQ